MRLPANLIISVLFACLSVSAPMVAATESSPQQNDGLARTLFDLANKPRAAHGLAELRWDDALAEAARKHAHLIADKNTLSHQFPGEADVTTRAREAGALFSKIAENIGLASSIRTIHENWIDSPPHRANILDPVLDSAGIAVVERNGVLFAVQDFSRAVAPLSLESQEKKIGALLASRGIQLLNNIPAEREIARKQCAQGSGTPGRRRTVLVFRFTTSDLSRLPDSLEQKIQNGRYRSAAVGACAPDKRSPFTSYRLAVLLY